MPTKNTLGDMHNLLMEQMERLATAKEEEIGVEIKRMTAMANGAAAINNNASTIIKLSQLRNEVADNANKMLTGTSDTTA